MSKWLNLLHEIEKNKEYNTLEANQEQLKESNVRTYQEFRKTMYLLGFSIVKLPFVNQIAIGLTSDLVTNKLKNEAEKFGKNICEEFISAYDEVLEDMTREYIKDEAKKSIQVLVNNNRVLTDTSSTACSTCLLIHKYNTNEFNQVEEDHASEVNKKYVEQIDKQIAASKRNELINKCMGLPFFVRSSRLAELLNTSPNYVHLNIKQVRKGIHRYRFGLESYRYKKSDILKFFNIEDAVPNGDIVKILQNKKDTYITQANVLKILSICKKSFELSGSKIAKFMPPIKSRFQETLYRQSDLIKFIERGGLDKRGDSDYQDSYFISEKDINTKHDIKPVAPISEDKLSKIDEYPKAEEDNRKNNDLDLVEAKFKALPFFVKSNQFADLLKITLIGFYKFEKKITKKIPRYRFGSGTYRYKKSDILNFFGINIPSIESDILKHLKKIKYKYLSRPNLMNLLCLSENSFYANKDLIEKFIPPIDLVSRNFLYQKSDLINFIERGGLDAH